MLKVEQHMATHQCCFQAGSLGRAGIHFDLDRQYFILMGGQSQIKE